MKIVVTGSLGHISQPLIRLLLNAGHKVTVVSSSESRRRQIEDLGAVAAIGSVMNVDFLKTSFTGADIVYCMTPPNDDEKDQIDYYIRVAQTYADAIKAVGVKRAIYLSSYGAHLSKGTGYITGSHHAEKIFDALEAVSVTHIRPGYFYYNLLNFIPAVKYAGVITANYGNDDKLLLVSPSDIAAAIAEEINTTESASYIRYVASDDRTCTEVAQVLGAAVGKPDLQWQTISSDAMQANLEKFGVPSYIAATLVELGCATHSGALREEYDQQASSNGRIKLEDFAKEFATAYQQQ